MSKITLLSYTPIEVIAEATSLPYQSKATNKLVKNVWNSGHRSIARHGMASFLIEGISQSLLRQISRHPHLNLTVKSTRYCDMRDVDVYIPDVLTSKDKLMLQYEYMEDLEIIMKIYGKWKEYEELNSSLKDIAKLFLPLASTTDLVMSGNYQALYEFCQLRNCYRAEAEIRNISLEITKILKDIMPEIFQNLGCKGDEYKICPEHASCGKYPKKEK